MKKKILCIGMLSLAMVCACNTTDTGNDTPSQTPLEWREVTNTPAPTGTPSPLEMKQLEYQQAYQRAEEFINSLETVDWTELRGSVDAETSRRNSNFLNYGYLTYDAEGNIYYVDRNTHSIYVSDYKGENKRLICEGSDAWGWMRLEGDWLYYGTQYTAIMRVHIETGEVEQICEEYSGHFRLEDGKLYREDRENGGLSSSDLDGKDCKLVQDTSGFYTGFFTKGDGYWMMEAVSRENQTTKKHKDYIVKVDGEKLMLLKQKGYHPLLAGNYFSIVDAENAEVRYVWNLETKERFVINSRTDQTIVSDGKNFYYKKMMYKDTTIKEGEAAPERDAVIFKWNGETTEEIWCIDSDNFYEMYITPKALYAMPQMKEEGKWVYHCLYYDLETGETGVIY